MVLRTALVLALLVFLNGASCAEGDICYMSGTKSSIVRDRLYFMGGNYSTETIDGQDIRPAASLYNLDLKTVFPVERNISESALQSDTISQEETIAYESAVNSTGGDSDGALWTFNDTFYAFGGLSSTITNQIAAYDLLTAGWRDVDVAGGDFNFGQRESAGFATAPELGLGFIAGGHTPHVPGMIRFDASDPNNLSWTNETLGNGSHGVEVPNLHGGAMIYIPAGNQGMLVVFGGRNVTETLRLNANPPIEADWRIIYVYDIESHTWWIQRASGDAPVNRVSFCAGLATSPDGSAFHITAYGGWNRRNGRSYEGVHILSIPSFQWFDATDLSSETNTESGLDRRVGRDAITGACQTYRGSQMIVLGGDVRSGRSYVANGVCSDVYHPIRVLDLSTYEWRSELDVEATYEVPSIIYSGIGGNSTGGATVTEPEYGFADPTLASLIKQRPAFFTTTLAPSPSASDDPTDQDQGSETNTGAIAGGVVGGVVGLALVLGFAFYFLRRRRAGRQRQDLSASSSVGIASPSTAVHDETKKSGFGPGPELHGDANNAVEMESPTPGVTVRAELPGSVRHELP